MRPRRGCQKKQNREYLPEQRAYPLCLDEYRDASIKRLGAKKPPESWHFPAAERAENRRCIRCRNSEFQVTIICPIPLSVKQGLT
ncbi:hypothetical protein ANACOL_00004 [Anaerotruncus colihominis DSM 17241]|uniref:Uncharacterized protein n=1 Tax=Anaerotruncus colihominis DSM 17241 TaxID=445972 RepID=B0P5I3_9FIRM|nr:hypothetical protein ANACOL_00004 [Anaerotruncus colihominis DSM 17241]